MTEKTETIKQTTPVDNPSIKKPWTPLTDTMVEKPYVQDLIDSSSGNYSQEELDIPVPEPVYKKPKITPAEAAEAAETEEIKEPINPDFDNLPHGEKLVLAEKSADAIIESYSQVIPILPIKFSSYDMPKLRALDLKGEISLDMPVTRDEKTLNQYALDWNTRVVDIFTVKPEVKLSIKGPLTDVLMEKGFVMTNTQRLITVVVAHLAQVGKSAYDLVIEKRDNMKTFVDLKKAADDRHAAEIRFRSTQQPQQQQPVTQNTEPITTKQEPAPPINTTVQEVQKNENKPEDDSIPFEEVEAPYTKPKIELTLDSYIDDDVIIDTPAND